MPDGANSQPSLTLTQSIVSYGTFPSRDGGSSNVSLGYVINSAASFAINGTSLATGDLLSISTNTALFSILGTTFGGNGSTNFALPNIGGNLLSGAGQGPGLSLRYVGDFYGNDGISITAGNLPTSFGGSGIPVNNIETTLTTHYVINMFGIYPSQGSGGVRLDTIGMVHEFTGNFAPNGTMFCEGQLLPIAEYETLFSIIGTTYGGDGQSTFALPDLRGRVPIGVGTGPGLSSVTLGEMSGSEVMTLTGATLPTGIGGGGQPLYNHQPTLGLTPLVALTGLYPSSGGSFDGETAYFGQLVWFAGNFAPGGWAIAQGQYLAINQNQALFSLLGTNFGGDGRTTFALPDLRGRAILGSDASHYVGSRQGSDTLTLALDDIPGRTQYGDDNDNAIYGGNHEDFFFGNGGNDTLVGNGGADDLRGGNGDDNLSGGDGNDTLYGNIGNDYLDGGTGADAMKGGTGDDTYIVDNAGDVVSEYLNQGFDTVRTSLASYTLTNHVENLVGTSGAGQTLTGNGLNNTITGGTGNDTLIGRGGNDLLDGGAGADAMDGGVGNDTYIVDNVGDVVIEYVTQGLDTVQTSLASYTLGANVENLVGTSGAGQTLTGNGLNNTITGGIGNDTLVGLAGNDRLDGGAGADAMKGGNGDDIYVVDNAGDVVTELAGQGFDIVQTSLGSYGLAANVENLVGTSGAGQALTGNGLNNTITANTGNDTLNGGAGSDTLLGLAGNDTLDGGTGADIMKGGTGDDTYFVDNVGDVVTEVAGQGVDTVRTDLSSYSLTFNVENLVGTSGAGQALTGNGLDNAITGGTGNDTLSGGAGNDTLTGAGGKDDLYGEGGADKFVFAAGDTAASQGGADRIHDFQHSQGDLIDLSAIDANAALGGDQAFTFIGSAAFSNVAGQLHYVQLAGSTYVEGDTNGDGIADFVIALDGTQALVNGDFIL